MTSDETILGMIREVRDLRVCKVDLWAVNFGRPVEEMQALFEIVAGERAVEMAA
jgi:hypothetical protein